MIDYCVMVFKPRRSDVFITGPFLDARSANQWIRDFGHSFPNAQFEIRILQRLEEAPK